MKQSQLKALKLSLMMKGVHGTAGLSPTAVLHLALEHELMDHGEYRRHLDALATGGDEPTPEPTPEPTRKRRKRAPVTIEATPEPTPEPTPTKEDEPMTDTAADLMAKLLATMQPKASLDEHRIIELINEHSPVKTVQVSFNGADPRKVEGVTHYAFEEILSYISCGLQLFLYGRSGAGKSYTAAQVADSLDLEFFSMGSILSKYEVLGTSSVKGYSPSVIRKWLDSDGGLLCIDEIDASDPRALVTIMALFDDGGQITFPDGVTCTRDASKHFIIVTANTTGNGASASYNGRTRLDGAIKARFIYVDHDYDQDIENSFAPQKTVDWVRRYRESVTKLGFDGCLVTPRHIKMAGLVVNNKNIERDQQRVMIENICKQSLTNEQHDAVIKGMK